LEASGMKELRVRGARRAGSQAGARRSSRRFSNPVYARLWAFLLALAAVFPAFAEEEIAPPPESGFFSAYALSFQSIAGAWIGQSEELVFRGNADGSGERLLSELLWGMRPVWYLGFTLEAAPAKASRQGVFVSARARFGLPGKSGLMQDRDWDDDAAPNRLTQFSEHTTVTHAALHAELNAGWNIPAGKAAAVRPYINGSCRYFSFSARDGYLDYSGSPIKSVYGEIMTFTQLFWTVSPGVSFQYTFELPEGRSVTLEPFAEAGLQISYSSHDNHILREVRGLQFFDKARTGIVFSGGAALHFAFKNRLGLRAAGAYTRLSGVRGTTVTLNTETGDAAPSTGSGAGFSFFDVSLALTFR
jgi:outer membrane protease